MNNRNKFDKKLEEFIGIEGEIEAELDKLDDEDETPVMHELVEYEPVPSKVPVEQRDSDYYDDYEYVRTVLRGVMQRGTTALENSLMLARETQHPRAFEVSSTIMKNLADTGKDLMALHKDKDNGGKPGSGVADTPKSQTNIQNNYYGESKGVDDLLDDLDDDKPTRKPQKKPK